MTEQEYRAVFASPHNDELSFGPPRESIELAIADKPKRAEETHEYLIGVQSRMMEPWRFETLATSASYRMRQ